jgi:farnesyl diphosphate synthase
MQNHAAHMAGGLDGALAQCAHAVEQALETVLPRPAGLYARVQDAMRYATFAGGKRLRPFLVMQGSALFAVPANHAVRTAAAIEVLHTYSLVHDDLPPMDNDDLRRGRATTHKAFDEATAILAGDGLLTIAFEILSDAATHPSADVRCELVSKLAKASGSEGMIGGQMIDMKAAEQQLTAEQVMQLQRLKTGALFEFACEAGAILGQASQADRDRMLSYARDFGLAFQITDDLLDVTSTAEKTGKTVGKDHDQGKATLISIYGVEGAKAEARKLVDRAIATLSPYGEKATQLQALAAYLLTRES